MTTRRQEATKNARPTAQEPPSNGVDARTQSHDLLKPRECAICQTDLVNRSIQIICAECTNPEVVLCVSCMAVGKETEKHKKTHAYRVSDCLAFPLVREHPVRSTAASNTEEPTQAPPPASATNASATTTTTTTTEWTAEEELALLDGIETFGLGNWKDIAEKVGTKSEKKCEQHYMSAYLSTSDLLPRFLDESEEVRDQEPSEAASTSAPTAVTAPAPTTAVTTTPTPMGATPSATTSANATLTSGTELAGYMPLRGDFDVEYDNEAELILADMEFNDDDHPTERELKLKVIQIYNHKLDERERRKKFVVERGLLDYKRHQQSERRRPKDERELIAQMRPFARFQTPQEHEEFVNGLITAMRLRKQILLLQEYRRNGVRTLAEAELYDVEKKKRETEQALQKQRESASYLYESGRPSTGGRERSNRWQNRDREDEPTTGGKAPRESESQKRTRGQSAGTTTNAAANGDTGAAPSYLIDGTPGSHLLTPKEKELCSKLKLLPKHYLVIKDAIVRESYRLGFLSESTAKEMIQMDVTKSGQIYDFFVRCGWVKTELTTTKVNAASPKPVPSAPAPSGVGKTPKHLTAAAPAAPAANVTPQKRKASEITESKA